MSRSVAGAPRRKRQQCTHRSITVLVHTVIVFLDGDLVSLVVWKCRVPLDKSEGVVKTEISWAVREHRLVCQRRLRTKTLEISPESLCGGVVPPTIDIWARYGGGVAIFSRFGLLKLLLNAMLDEIMVGLVRYGDDGKPGDGWETRGQTGRPPFSPISLSAGLTPAPTSHPSARSLVL